MINYAPGSSIHVGDKQYTLKQFHFHRPSEEKINGKTYDMVAHLVHADQDGNLAVVAVLLEKGNNNPLIRELWSDLPKEKEKEERTGHRHDQRREPAACGHWLLHILRVAHHSALQ